MERLVTGRRSHTVWLLVAPESGISAEQPPLAGVEF